MQRRTFLRSSSVLALTSLVPLASAANAPRQPKFSLKYAPHPGTFKTKAGADYLDQVRFAADQGFTAWEDNGIKEHTPAMQEKIGSELKRLGMTMGVFVAYGSFDRPTFVRKDQATWSEITQTITDSVAVAKRVGATWMTVVPGSVDQQHKDDAKWNRYGGPRLGEGYSTQMDALFTGMQMQRTQRLPNWHAHDEAVLKEFTALGGKGIPSSGTLKTQ